MCCKYVLGKKFGAVVEQGQIVGSILSRGNEICNIFHFLALVMGQIAAFSSATQHAMSPGFGGKKWNRYVLKGMECLNIKFLGFLCVPC